MTAHCGHSVSANLTTGRLLRKQMAFADPCPQEQCGLTLEPAGWWCLPEALCSECSVMTP